MVKSLLSVDEFKAENMERIYNAFFNKGGVNQKFSSSTPAQQDNKQQKAKPAEQVIASPIDLQTLNKKKKKRNKKKKEMEGPLASAPSSQPIVQTNNLLELDDADLSGD